MSNQFLHFSTGGYKCPKVCEGIQFWQISFQRLFHSRNNHFFQSFFLYHFPLRMFSIQKGDFINSHFSTLFQHPFDPVDILSWGNSQMQTKRTTAIICPLFQHLYSASSGIRAINHPIIPITPSVHQRHRLSFCKT